MSSTLFRVGNEKTEFFILPSKLSLVSVKFFLLAFLVSPPAANKASDKGLFARTFFCPGLTTSPITLTVISLGEKFD